MRRCQITGRKLLPGMTLELDGDYCHRKAGRRRRLETVISLGQPPARGELITAVTWVWNTGQVYSRFVSGDWAYTVVGEA